MIEPRFYVRFGISDAEDREHVKFFETEEEVDEAIDEWMEHDNSWAFAVDNLRKLGT